MEDYNPSFNPFSPENHSPLITTLWTFLIMGALVMTLFLIDRYVIPKLNPESNFVKWWRKHIIDEDPFDHL